MKILTLDAPASGAFLSNVTAESLLAPVRQEPRKASSAFETLLLHTVSHELRTPFSVIQSSAELLEMMRVDPLVTEQARTIMREIGQVTSLVNRLLQFSRFEPGEIAAQMEPADIELATRACIEGGFAPWTDGRAVTVKVTGKPRMVRMDPDIYRLVLKNLVENACKYSTGKRAPQVHLRYAQASWSVSVRDYGIGIPDADLARLFKPFSRGSNVGDIPGFGLGLRIAHYLVNNFCGTLNLASQERKGTTATATFLYR